MKKLFVLALSALMILSMVAVSMAAPVFTGEGNFKVNNSSADSTFIQSSDFKITMDNKVNDFLSLNAALKAASGVDIAWDKFSATLSPSFGTIQIGNFGYTFNGGLNVGYGIDSDTTGIGGSTVLVARVIPDMKSNVGTLVMIPVGEALAIKAYYSFGQSTVGIPPLGEGAYAATLAYTGESFGGDLSFVQPQVTGVDSGYAVNAYYNATEQIKVYLNYEAQKDSGIEFKNTIVGALGTFDAITARLEYDANKPDGAPANAMGIVLGYTVKDTTFQYTNAKNTNDLSTNEVKMTVKF